MDASPATRRRPCNITRKIRNAIQNRRCNGEQKKEWLGRIDQEEKKERKMFVHEVLGDFYR
jgi:hypothetical protein